MGVVFRDVLHAGVRYARGAQDVESHCGWLLNLANGMIVGHGPPIELLPQPSWWTRALPN